jgi:hypothetical protein
MERSILLLEGQSSNRVDWGGDGGEVLGRREMDVNILIPG